MTTAIQPYRGGDSAPLVRLATAGVAAEIRLDGCERYELRMASEHEDVTARLVATLRGGEVVELGALAIPCGSAVATRFPIVLLDRKRIEHVHFEISGSESLRIRVEAPQPPARFRLPVAFRATGAMLLGASVVGGGVAAAFALPQPPALAAPSRAVAGETARIAYATHGLGARTFAATRDDGMRLAGGNLADRRGEITFALPPSAANHRVDVELKLRGPLGAVSGTSSFAVTTPVAPTVITEPPPVARIAAFAAHRERYGGMETVLASYLAVAESGVLTISNEHGRVIARGPFAHVGTQRIALPPDAQASALTARLEVRRGASRASSSVGLPPAVLPVVPRPDEAPASANDVPEAVTPADDKAAVASSDDPVAVLGNPVAGRPFSVSIRTASSGMRLRLEDDAGNAVADVAVPPGQRTVSLAAPESTTTRTYYLTCSYGNGNTQEVVVRSVRVSAH